VISGNGKNIIRKSATALYPEILLEPRRTLPNLTLCLNRSGKKLDRRFFLPLANAAQFFGVRNIMLMGENPTAHPDFAIALSSFSGKGESLSLWIKPGQSSPCADIIAHEVNEIIFRLGPYSGTEKIWMAELRALRSEVRALRKERPHLIIKGVFHLSSATLRAMENVIHRMEEALFDRLEFFPPNLFLNPESEPATLPLSPELIPSHDELIRFEENFWEMLDEHCFQSWLFDLEMTRRQLERVLLFFKSASCRGAFEPPHCRASRISFYVEPTGHIRCCPWQEIFGNLQEMSLHEIEECEHVHDFRSKISLATDRICQKCPGDFPHFLWRSH